MRYVRCCLTAIMPWLSLLALTSCKGVLQWTSTLDWPRITNVRALGAPNRTLSTGIITIRAEFSEQINIDDTNGTPYITLNTSPTSSRADFTNCSTVVIGLDTKYVCDFQYVIGANENSALLDYVSTSALNLNGAVIVDNDGHNLITSLPSAGSGKSLAQSNLEIDTLGPSVSSVTALPANRTFVDGETVEIIVTFSEDISITSGTPELTLSNGKTLTYNSSATLTFTPQANELVFVYTVGSTDTAVSQLNVASTGALTGNIEDPHGNLANRTLPNSGPNSLTSSSVEIDPSGTSSAPYIVSVRASQPAAITLGTGEEAYLRVRFDRNITINSAVAYMNLDADMSNNSEGVLTGFGANSSELIFKYTAGTGHSTDSLNYQSFTSASSASIELTSGTIQGSAAPTLDAELELPDDSLATSLIQSYAPTRNNNNIKVVPYQRPGQVQSFSAGFVGHTTPTDSSDDYAIKLSWTAPATGTPTNYKIVRSVDSSAFSEISNSSAMSEFYDTDVVLGKTYTYQIRAVTDELTSNSLASDTANLEIAVVPTYGANGYNWNDYVSVSSASGGMVTGESEISIHSAFVPSGSSCSPGSMVTYRDCIHGGERRKIVLYGVTQAQCDAGVTVNEFEGSTAQNIFEWSDCVWADNSQMAFPATGDNPPSNVAVVYATGFKEGKGLRDLVDFTNGRWKSLKAKVTIGSTTYETPTYDWWGNEFAPLPVSNAVSVLNLLSKIYYFNSDITTGGYNLAANKISVVGPSTATLKWNTGSAANTSADGTTSGTLSFKSIIATAKDHIWIEANMNAENTASSAVIFGAARASRIHNSVSRKASFAGWYWSLSKANLVSNSSIGGSGVGFFASSVTGSLFKKMQITDSNSGECFYTSASHKNTLASVSTSNCNGSGIEIFNGFNNNLSQIISTNNNNHGVYMNGGNYNTLTAITVSNNEDSGLELNNSQQTIVHSVLATHNGTGSEPSIAIQNPNSTENTLSQIAVSRNNDSNNVLTVAGGASLLKFTGHFIAEGSATCAVSGSFVGINSTCDPTTSDYDSGDKRASNHFRTAITDGDVNFYSFDGDPTDAYGASTTSYALISISSLLNGFIPNIFKAWGRSPSSTPPPWPDAGFVGNCVASDDCIINDWRLTISGTGNPSIVRNTTSDGVQQNGLQTSGASCTAEIENDNLQTSSTLGAILESHPYTDDAGYLGGQNAEDVTVCDGGGGSSGGSSGTCTTKKAQRFHKVAIETMGDLNGDDDGLCENEELCLYMPNFGAYQGDGSINDCTTNNSAIRSSGGTMLFYEGNGVN